jgi:O-acetyl-ADP-ribose deacetylase (regulator of RNase III)
MKICYKIGDLLAAEEPMIAHGCNAQGVMGKGVAKAVKETLPEVFKAYRRQFVLEQKLDLGTVVYVDSHAGKLWCNCITQGTYDKNPIVPGTTNVDRYVDYDAIRSCMRDLNARAIEEGYASIAMPMIGAGLGGGDWDTIAQIIEEEFTTVVPVVYVLDNK